MAEEGEPTPTHGVASHDTVDTGWDRNPEAPVTDPKPGSPSAVDDDTNGHPAITADWVIRTAEGDQMRAAARLSTSWPLLRMYAIRQVHLRYRQSALGLAWTLVQPIAVMAIYGFIFTQFFQVGGGDFPYLSMAWTGLTIWGFVQVSVQMGALSLLNDAYMLSRVWFPREIIPLAPVMAGLVDLAAGVIILIPLVMIQGVGFSIHALAVPVIFFVLVVWVAAISLLTSTITIFFRDMTTIVGLGLRLLFIATPVMYEASVVPPKFGWVLSGNPFAVVVNNTRNTLLAHVWPNWNLLAFHGTVGVVLLYLGLKYLRAVERRMVDIV